MKRLKKVDKIPNRKKILQNLTIDGEGIGYLSVIEIDLPLSRTFLSTLLSDFAKGKKDIWDLKDTVDVFCTTQETILMDHLKNWDIELTGVSLTIFITETQIKSCQHPFIIEWAVLSLFKNPTIYKISIVDVFVIKKFLTTPFYQLIEIFEEWEKYWHSRRIEEDKSN